MEYSQDALYELSQKVDLLEYASHTVDFVKQSGGIHFAVCPFHSEKTASLAVYEDTQTFHCYGCGATGNIFTWIQLTENLTFMQSVQKIAELTNSNIQDYLESDTIHFYKTLNRLINTQKKELPHRTILDINKDYFEKFKDEMPKEWLSEGISESVMKKYEIRVDQSSNRIVYPVYDSDDNLIGIKGRTRFKNYKDLKIMKYMNYQSLGGRVDYLQGMKQARKYIEEKNEIIILEGIKSVMKIDGWGYHNAVSAETSTLNEYQVELLVKMHIKDIVIAFDKDVNINKIRECAKLLRKFTNCFVMIDKWKMIGEKDSPCDCGKEVWDTLYERRVRI